MIEASHSTTVLAGNTLLRDYRYGVEAAVGPDLSRPTPIYRPPRDDHIILFNPIIGPLWVGRIILFNPIIAVSRISHCENTRPVTEMLNADENVQFAMNAHENAPLLLEASREVVIPVPFVPI